MNTPDRPIKQPILDSIFEPFPEPRAFPDGWDLSALMPDSELPGSFHSEEFVDD